MASPLEQFKIVPIVDIEVADIDISFTNSSLWMAITAAVLVIFMRNPWVSLWQKPAKPEEKSTRLEACDEDHVGL